MTASQQWYTDLNRDVWLQGSHHAVVNLMKNLGMLIVIINEDGPQASV